MPLPPEGAIGIVYSTLYKVAERCSDVVPDADARGVDGGLRMFAARDGRVLGVMLVGYMFAELFVAPGVTWADLDRMRSATNAEVGHQAE
jgi:hypothetical protein